MVTIQMTGSNTLSLTVLMVEGLTCFRVDISFLIKLKKNPGLKAWVFVMLDSGCYNGYGGEASHEKV